MNVAIFDYGTGNSTARRRSKRPGARVVRADARSCECGRAVLPVARSFGGCPFTRSPNRDAIRNGLPTLGICLGMQPCSTAATKAAAMVSVIPTCANEGDRLLQMGGTKWRRRPIRCSMHRRR